MEDPATPKIRNNKRRCMDIMAGGTCLSTCAPACSCQNNGACSLLNVAAIAATTSGSPTLVASCPLLAHPLASSSQHSSACAIPPESAASMRSSSPSSSASSLSSSSSDSWSSFDCQALQRCLKRVRLSSSVISPGELRLQRDLRHAVLVGGWIPVAEDEWIIHRRHRAITARSAPAHGNVARWEVSTTMTLRRCPDDPLLLIWNICASQDPSHTSSSNASAAAADPSLFPGCTIWLHFPRLYPHRPPVVRKIKPHCCCHCQQRNHSYKHHSIPRVKINIHPRQSQPHSILSPSVAGPYPNFASADGGFVLKPRHEQQYQAPLLVQSMLDPPRIPDASTATPSCTIYAAQSYVPYWTHPHPPTRAILSSSDSFPRDAHADPWINQAPAADSCSCCCHHPQAPSMIMTEPPPSGVQNHCLLDSRCAHCSRLGSHAARGVELLPSTIWIASSPDDGPPLLTSLTKNDWTNTASTISATQPTSLPHHQQQQSPGVDTHEMVEPQMQSFRDETRIAAGEPMLSASTTWSHSSMIVIEAHQWSPLSRLNDILDVVWEALQKRHNEMVSAMAAGFHANDWDDPNAVQTNVWFCDKAGNDLDAGTSEHFSRHHSDNNSFDPFLVPQPSGSDLHLGGLTVPSLLDQIRPLFGSQQQEQREPFDCNLDIDDLLVPDSLPDSESKQEDRQVQPYCGHQSCVSCTVYHPPPATLNVPHYMPRNQTYAMEEDGDDPHTNDNRTGNHDPQKISLLWNYRDTQHSFYTHNYEDDDDDVDSEVKIKEEHDNDDVDDDDDDDNDPMMLDVNQSTAIEAATTTDSVSNLSQQQQKHVVLFPPNRFDVGYERCQAMEMS